MTKVWFSDVVHFPSFSTVSARSGHGAGWIKEVHVAKGSENADFDLWSEHQTSEDFLLPPLFETFLPRAPVKISMPDKQIGDRQQCCDSGPIMERDGHPPKPRPCYFITEQLLLLWPPVRISTTPATAPRAMSAKVSPSLWQCFQHAARTRPTCLTESGFLSQTECARSLTSQPRSEKA